MSLYVLLSIGIAGISIYLASNCKYEDGVIGKIALGVLAIGNFVVVAEFVSGIEYLVNPTTLFIQFGVFMFLIRHAYRFRKWVKTGAHDWRKNEANTVSDSAVCPFLTSPRNKETR